jgi:hypothetical protein
MDAFCHELSSKANEQSFSANELSVRLAGRLLVAILLGKSAFPAGGVSR